MKSIHLTLRVLITSLLTIAFMTSPVFAGARPAAKAKRFGAAAKRREVSKPASKHKALRRQPGASKSARNAQRRLEAQRRAEAARLARIAQQRAAEDALRDHVQQMIARDEIAGEDPEIRRIAVNALGKHAGTVVIMDPKSGRIYSIVNQQWAVREGFKPCSTIKLVTGLAGLNESVIDPANASAGADSKRVNLTRALAYSKNLYFQEVGEQVGADKMISYARQVGLGTKTGVNLRNESAGRLPALRAGTSQRIFSHGDGFKVTALQLATLASVFANRGRVVVPFVVNSHSNPRATVARFARVNSASWQSMVPGMVGAVRYGSGRKAYDPMTTIAGKTGTCIENGNWVGLFASYAPLDDPRLVIVVIARGSDGRNHFPAAVAGRIYRELSSRSAKFADTTIAASSNRSLTSTDLTEVAEQDDEESEEDVVTVKTADETRPANQTIWGTERNLSGSKVKKVIMPVARPRRIGQQ